MKITKHYNDSFLISHEKKNIQKAIFINSAFKDDISGMISQMQNKLQLLIPL